MVYSARWFVSVKAPIFTSWLACNSPARVRATLISLDGQMDALGQIAGGPPIGLLGTIFSLRVALATLSAILAPVLLLYAAALRKVRSASSLRHTDEEIITPVS